MRPWDNESILGSFLEHANLIAMRLRFIPVSAVLFLALLPSLPAGEPEVRFEDRFEEKPGDGWSWRRENPETWRIAEGTLEIRLEPGDAATVKNALVRPAPDRSEGRIAVEVTVRNLAAPTEQYEQAGITWYRDGKPVFKLVKERVDGKIVIVPGKVPVDDVPVRLRLEIAGNRYTAKFRPEGKEEFTTAAEGDLPLPEKDEVSLQGYHGPADADHRVRFDDFRVLRLKD